MQVGIYRKIEDGEKLAWTGSTDQQGVVRPNERDPGYCRVLACSGKLSTTSRLGNSDGSRTCKLNFGPPISVEQQRTEMLETVAKNAHMFP